MSALERWKKVQKLNIPVFSTVTQGLKSKTKPYVIGLDISFVKENPNTAVCTAVMLKYDTCELIDQETKVVKLTHPYIAGFLAFRELDSYIMVYQNLMGSHLDKQDKIAFVMLDGNGILHPLGIKLTFRRNCRSGHCWLWQKLTPIRRYEQKRNTCAHG